MNDKPGEIRGVFIGLDSSTYEYLASIIAPFQQEYIPEVGGFMLIDNLNEYIVARIMDYVPKGEFMSSMGMKWLSDVALEPHLIGQDIKIQKVSYQVKIKLLGRLDKNLEKFTPGISKIPHITSKVIEPLTKIIETICNKALEVMEKGIVIGNYWLDSSIDIHFNVEELIGKRTFIFARAGYGKSNLMKILASHWKKEYGGLIIFDPEGEYSITDRKGRPGIMDSIPAILITNRKRVKQELGVNVYDSLKFDLRKFHPNFIIPILVVESKHELIFFQKLMGLDGPRWANLVDLLYQEGWRADHQQVANVMNLGNTESIPPILNNLVLPIKKLHDPKSALLNIVESAIRDGIPIIMDISLLDSRSALQLSSTIVSYFFNNNQRQFTGGKEDLDKIVFVVEEAQSVIGGSTNVAKFVELAKEGRKYQLGGIFITQQPGSISKEILSQGDNFFVFHLLSKGDLKSLQDTNAHYSNDILTQILNEPIKGKAYMWSSNQPFVLPIKTHNFEEQTKPNKAKDIQLGNNLLDKYLKEISDFHTLQINIFQKLKNIIEQKKVSLRDRESVFGIQKELTISLFRSLSDDERQYIEENGGIQKNTNTGEAFAITFPYFKTIYENCMIYFSDQTKSN